MLNTDDEYMGVDCTITFFFIGDSFTDIKFTYIQFIHLKFIEVSNHTTINLGHFSSPPQRNLLVPFRHHLQISPSP